MGSTALIIAQLIVQGAPSVIDAIKAMRSKEVIGEAEAVDALTASFREKDSTMSEHDARVAAVKALHKSS